ncbi:MAG: hypothetical protein Kow00114_07480 [Kiloniellaceae bacterium]
MPVQLRSIYIGPNIHLPVAAIRWTFTTALPAAWQSPGTASDFLAPLFPLLPALRAAVERALPAPGAKLTVAATGGLPLAEATMHLAMALQALTGHAGRQRKIVTDGGRIDIVCAYKQIPIGLHAMTAADLLIHQLCGDPAPTAAELAGAVEQFRRNAGRDGLDATTRILVQAAEARGLPWLRLDPHSQAVQIGHGRYSRRLSSSLLDGEAALGAGPLSHDPVLAARLLKEAGLPVPRQRTARMAEDAVAAADALDYPVTLRQVDRAAGSSRLLGQADNAGEAAAAAAQARPGEGTFVVEKTPQGIPHRLLVVGGRLAAAIAPRPGRAPLDVTARLHPDVRRAAVLAADALGLAVAEVGFVSPDIALSRRAAGAITTVRAAPDLVPYFAANGTWTKAIADAMLDLLYPPGEPHHLPIATVTGTNGKTTTTHMTARILRQAGLHVGWCSTIGAGVDGETIAKGDLAGPGGFYIAARSRKVDAIVAEVARGALIRRGMSFPAADVGVVTNVTTDHLGEFGVETLEQMAAVKRVVAHAVTGTLVLNAEDARCLAMARGARARRLCLVALDESNPAVARHRAAGGAAAVLAERGGRPVLLLCQGDRESEIIAADAMPAAFGGLARHNLQNALFAVGLAHGLGIGAEIIGAALAGFHCDRETVPGRVNSFDGLPFKVILDYGHNPGGYRMVGPLVTGLAAGQGRRICVFTSPADRNDAFLAEIAEAAAPHFDIFVCRQGFRQSIEPGSVTDKLREALVRNGVAADNIIAGLSPEESVLTGLKAGRPGDVVYIMVPPDSDGGFWDLVEKFADDYDGKKASA